MTATWHPRAACYGADPRLFDRPRPAVGYRLDEARMVARTYCDRCPVIADCRAWADGDETFEGVAGGLLYGPLDTGRWGRTHGPVELLTGEAVA